MGNYSYHTMTEGCKIDVDALKKTIDNNKDTQKIFKTFEVMKSKKDMESGNLGQIFDGWKIQGYWYANFCNMLYSLADHMPNINDKLQDNYIEMEEEQGYKFRIHFVKKNGYKEVYVTYQPMEWLWAKVNKTDLEGSTKEFSSLTDIEYPTVFEGR